MKSVVVCSAKRTPFGKFGGDLKEIPAVELGALAIKKVKENISQVDINEVDDVILGHCLPGSGLSPARLAVLAAGWPVQTNGLTVDRACCSALTAIGLGYQRLATGLANFIIAGGMENMSRTPYLIPQARWGQRLGDFMVEDELVIRNPYVGAPMARYAGEFALEKGVTREEQDAWALRSQEHWLSAHQNCKFIDELFNVQIPNQHGKKWLDMDQHPRPATSLEKLKSLKTVYGSPTVTPGNASGIADGAAAIFLTTEDLAKQREIPILATIVNHTYICGEPRESPALPGLAIKKLLKEMNFSLEQMKLIEINEAFAAMPLVSSLVLTDFDIGKAEKLRQRINVNGGAVAIGHPLGATGARLVMSMVYELRRIGGGYGVVAICGAIGQADVAIIKV